jgi:teichuronic acid biosynthesis glycosyltransferase TuaC
MSGPLRVLSIATLFPDATRPNFGIFVERSLAALAAQPGVELTVVAPVGLPIWPLSVHARYAPMRALPAQEDWHGLNVLRPRWRLWPGMGAGHNGVSVADAVQRAIGRRAQFDIVDAQFFHPDAVAAERVARALSRPFSAKARGSDIAYWGGHRDTGAGIIEAADAAAGLLAVSAALKAEMVALGMAAEKIMVHPTGIDAALFCPGDRAAARARWGLGDGPVLLSVGTLNANKGQHLVIDALPDLSDAHYLIAGTGPDAEALAARAQALGVAARVRLLGNVPHAELPALYTAADIAVQPSAKEGLANVWVEAMACGTPVIAADIAPAREVIDAPDKGRLVTREPGAIAAAVRALLATPPDRAALSAATHARFSWARHGAAHAAHLRALAGAG